MHLKHLGITISTLTSSITPGWDQYTFLNERLGMFYKAARSRAQANGKVSLNHCSIRHLKVKRQSYIIWGEVEGEWQEAGRGQGTFWSCRLSISGHMLHVLQTVSEILPNTPYVSSNLLTAYFNISTQHLIGLYWVSKLNHRNTIANDTLFILDSAAKKERQLQPPF